MRAISGLRDARFYTEVLHHNGFTNGPSSKNSRSGVYYYRQKVPADPRQIVGRTEVSRSLRTKDPEEAKRLNAIEVRKQTLEWEALRSKPEPLPQKQIVALSGVAYRDYLSMLENEPGEAEVWHQFLALHKRMTGNPGALDDWYGSFVDDLLLEHGISTDDSSRTRLINAVHSAMGLAGEGHLRRSEGDYSPDPRVERFPAHSARGALHFASSTLNRHLHRNQRQKSPRSPCVNHVPAAVALCASSRSSGEGRNRCRARHRGSRPHDKSPVIRHRAPPVAPRSPGQTRTRLPI